MNQKAVLLTILGIGLVSASGWARAAETPVSVTGCLSQGDEANEYAIRDASGKTFGLRSSKVNLKSHFESPCDPKRHADERKRGGGEEREKVRKGRGERTSSGHRSEDDFDHLPVTDTCTPGRGVPGHRCEGEYAGEKLESHR